MTLRVSMLGTSGAVPTPERNPSGIYLNREGDEFLFDCGEGTQRQMMRFGTGFGISHIFVTHGHGDHVYGLPGLLETLAFNDRSASLTIVVPPGLTTGIKQLAHGMDGELPFPLSVKTAPPGQPVIEREDYEIRAFETDHDTTAVGYALIEYKRKGRFDREKAEALGVPVGPKFSQLHDGTPVQLADGRTVFPEDVVGPPRPGRRVVYTGDTRPTRETVVAAEQADLLIHDGTFRDDCTERATTTGHSTAREAGRIAAESNARRLVLTHFSSRYGPQLDPHRRQAAAVFDGEVIIPDDGRTIEVPYPEA